MMVGASSPKLEDTLGLFTASQQVMPQPAAFLKVIQPRGMTVGEAVCQDCPRP